MRINLKIRNFRTLVIGTSIILFGYLYLTPYVSIFLFKSAIDRKDSKMAEKYIDFPSVRDSLKPQVQYYVKESVRRKSEGRPIYELGRVIFDPIITYSVDSIVNSTVTLSGLKLLIEKGEFAQLQEENTTSDIPIDNDGNNKINLYYKNINVFILSTHIEGRSSPVKTFWKRKTFLNWELNHIELPSDLFD